MFHLANFCEFDRLSNYNMVNRELHNAQIEKSFKDSSWQGRHIAGTRRSMEETESFKPKKLKPEYCQPKCTVRNDLVEFKASPVTTNIPIFTSAVTTNIPVFTSPATTNIRVFTPPATTNIKVFTPPATANIPVFTSPVTTNIPTLTSPVTMASWPSPNMSSNVKVDGCPSSNSDFSPKSALVFQSASNNVTFNSPSFKGTDHVESPRTDLTENKKFQEIRKLKNARKSSWHGGDDANSSKVIRDARLHKANNIIRKKESVAEFKTRSASSSSTHMPCQNETSFNGVPASTFHNKGQMESSNMQSTNLRKTILATYFDQLQNYINGDPDNLLQFVDYIPVIHPDDLFDDSEIS